jgi:hypothetical protein
MGFGRGLKHIILLASEKDELVERGVESSPRAGSNGWRRRESCARSLA